MNQIPRKIEHLALDDARPFALVLSFDNGETHSIDLETDVTTDIYGMGCLSDPEVFKSAHIIDFGTSIGWAQFEDIEIGVDTLWHKAMVAAGEEIDADAFRAWRQEANLTQEQAASMLGVSRRTIANYETGGYEISRSILLAIEALRARQAASKLSKSAGPTLERTPAPQRERTPYLSRRHAVQIDRAIFERVEQQIVIKLRDIATIQNFGNFVVRRHEPQTADAFSQWVHHRSMRPGTFADVLGVSEPGVVDPSHASAYFGTATATAGTLSAIFSIFEQGHLERVPVLLEQHGQRDEQGRLRLTSSQAASLWVSSIECAGFSDERDDQELTATASVLFGT